jgi:nitroreductase
VRQRKTLKVLADPDAPLSLSQSSATEHDQRVLEAIRTAGWAPFHYDRDMEGIAEPWRATFLPHTECRAIAGQLDDWIGGGGTAGKLPAMFSACGAAVLVTWLPQFRDIPDAKPEQIAVDDEHLAAASAMTQTMLLLLTAQGMGTYWSSGGKLRQPEVLKRLGIDGHEALLAVVFIEYPETQAVEVERKPGKHRDRRSDRWLRVGAER